MKLYHQEVYFPKDIIKGCEPLYEGYIRYTRHVRERIESTSHGYSVSKSRLKEIISNIKIESPTPFEIETDDDNNVTKCVIRHDYDDRRDICLVFRKDLLVTVWYNDKEDLHKTLNKTIYEQPPKL